MLNECYAVVMQCFRTWIPAVLFFSLSFSAFSQETPTFKSQSQLVIVPVTVTDKKGNRIWDLKEEDFTLLDNGQKRKVTVEPWGTYESHISLVVVVETSFLSDAALTKIRKMASLLTNITGDTGEIAVISADSSVHSLLDFTTQWEPLQEAFEKLHSSTDRAGHVLDGVSAGIVLLAHRPSTNRRIILMLSEGHDRGSHARSMDVLTFAEKENVIIYSITYSPFVTPFTVKYAAPAPMSSNNPRLPPPPTTVAMAGVQNVAPATLELGPNFAEIVRSFRINFGKTLADYTGGRELSFATQDRLENDLTTLSVEVHSQYQISFVPPDDKMPVYHEIEVQVNHPDLVVRARPGYWIGVPVVEKKPEPTTTPAPPPPTSK